MSGDVGQRCRSGPGIVKVLGAIGGGVPTAGAGLEMEGPIGVEAHLRKRRGSS